MNTRILLIAFCLATAEAQADWADFSVAYLCDAESGTFSLAPLVATSATFNVAGGSGYEKLAQGIDRNLVCTVKQHRVSMTYTSVGPQESGMCAGIGFSEIRSLTVGGIRVVGGEPINSGCFFEETLVSIKLNFDADVINVERCSVKGWDWDEGYTDLRCTKAPLR